MEEEDVGVGNHKFTRCIICNSYTLSSQCFNIFSTILENGDIHLSEFVKNVLDCSVLIVVPPDFFVCKRCYTVCSELDYSIARCDKLQRRIKYLFKMTQANREAIYNGSKLEEVNNEYFDEDEEIYQGHGNDQKVDCEEQIFDEDVEDINEKTNSQTQIKEAEEETIIDNSSQLIEDGVYWEPNQEIFYEEIQDSDVVNEEIVEDETHDTLEHEVACNIEITELTNEGIQDPVKNQVTAPEIKQEYTSIEDLLGMVWFCKPCNLKFENLESLKQHKKSVTCNSRSKNFEIKSAYEFKNYTVKLKKKEKVFYCNYCTFESPTSESMEKHVVSHKSDPPLMCDVCGRRFKTRSTFKRHQLVHDESRPFACKQCTFRSESELTLKIHQRLHDDKKQFTCTMCSYKTIRKMSYISHLRTHTGERPFCCPDCPYRSKDSSTLIRHRRTHGGLKRYHCTVCNYKALQKNSLTRHMMIHTGEKPHSCPYCDYSSTLKYNLADHITSKHSTDKPFTCHVCSYKTKNKRQLKYHLRIHSGEKPYACSLCDFRVRHRAGLSYHMRTKHPPDGEAPQTKVMKFVHIPEEDIQFSDNEEEQYFIAVEDE